jgi:hypothetical protein
MAHYRWQTVFEKKKVEGVALTLAQQLRQGELEKEAELAEIQQD